MLLWEWVVLPLGVIAEGELWVEKERWWLDSCETIKLKKKESRLSIKEQGPNSIEEGDDDDGVEF